MSNSFENRLEVLREALNLGVERNLERKKAQVKQRIVCIEQEGVIIFFHDGPVVKCLVGNSVLYASGGSGALTGVGVRALPDEKRAHVKEVFRSEREGRRAGRGLRRNRQAMWPDGRRKDVCRGSENGTCETVFLRDRQVVSGLNRSAAS